MEQLIKDLVEIAKKDREVLRKLRLTAIEAGNTKLIMKLAEMELELFPETPEQTEAKRLGIDLRNAFGMANLKVDNKGAWIGYKVFEGYKKKKGNFSLRDAAKIMSEADRLFPFED